MSFTGYTITQVVKGHHPARQCGLRFGVVPYQINTKGGIQMTDLEIKYWDLMEKRRANQEQERLKAQDVESQVALRKAQEAVQSATVPKLTEETKKITEEIYYTAARTDLTKAEKVNKIADTIKKATEVGLNIQKFLDKPIDQFKEFVGSALGGKTFGKLFI